MHYNDLMEGLSTGTISPYQLYNLDIDYPQYFAVKHYLENPNDSIDIEQKIHKVYVDIELYSDNKFDFDTIDKGLYPINSITIYSNYTNTFHVYFLLNKKNIELFETQAGSLTNLAAQHKEYISKKYLTSNNNFEIIIKTYTSDLALIKECFQQIHNLDPVILTGFNSDNFDYPYIYYRLKKLLNNNQKEVTKVLSKFNDYGNVTINKYGKLSKVNFIEYINADILYLFKPSNDGGYNLGKKLSSYSLDFISSNLFNLQKVEHDVDLDTFYIENPTEFLLYNIIDVVLTYMIDEKLKLTDRFNSYRRLMYSPMDSSLRGASLLFDSLMFYQISKENKAVRFGINLENEIDISDKIIANLHQPLSKNKFNWSVTSIDSKTFTKVTNHFPGAYVKASPGKLFDSKLENQIITDLDYTSLYPSMVRQFNIDIQTYYGRILDTETTKKLLVTLDSHMIDKSPNDEMELLGVLMNSVENYLKSGRITVTNKSTAKQEYYYVLAFLYGKLTNSGYKSIKEMFSPTDYKSYIYLKKYLIPFLNLVSEIHPKGCEFNNYCFEYIVNDKFAEKSCLIIEDIMKPSIRIKQVLSDDLNKYLKENNLIMTLTGCLFDRHDKNLGTFVNWLNEMYARRKQYIKLRDEQDPKSFEYQFYDMAQSTVKVSMNTLYGLFGLSTYRYSDSWLAKTITVHGRFSLKLSQEIAHQYLTNLGKNNVSLIQA